jgi:signal transduction histidine kinase
MSADPTVIDTVRASIADLRSAHEAAVSRATENSRLRAELADQVAQRVRAEAERDHLEEQFREVQKLDASGKTLEDMVHEFNNILSAVLGFGELLQPRLAGDPEGLNIVGEIVAAGGRGRQLIDRLLRLGQPTPVVKEWLSEYR